MSDCIEVVASLIRKGNTFLICKRPAYKARGGLWEFPGGKVYTGEKKSDALIRECFEELGIIISVVDVFSDVVYEYPDITIHLTVMDAQIERGNPILYEHTDMAWITPMEIDNYDFCPADEYILKEIKERFV